jgi:hypothetical protein
MINEQRRVAYLLEQQKKQLEASAQPKKDAFSALSESSLNTLRENAEFLRLRSLLDASRPVINIQQPSPIINIKQPTNCRSYRLGNSIHTDCN